jgi:hypothetical protein
MAMRYANHLHQKTHRWHHLAKVACRQWQSKHLNTKMAARLVERKDAKR